jgi:hypothetical protein
MEKKDRNPLLKGPTSTSIHPTPTEGRKKAIAWPKKVRAMIKGTTVTTTTLERMPLKAT